jgi:hypothetical protein
MIANKFSSGTLLLLGFLIMGGVSVILNFKQARAVDAMGDVAKVNAEIRQLKNEMQEEGTDEGDREKLREKIEKLQKEDLIEQREDAINAMAALPNGAVLWSFLSQVGAGAFGLGVLGVFLREEEHPIVRSTALVVVGALILAFIIARTVYLLVGGSSGLGGSM